LSEDGRLLAYFDFDMTWGGNSFEYKNWNGSFSHKMEASRENFRAITPYQGVIARSYYNTTVQGRWFYYFCGVYQVDQAQFEQCVKQQFSEVVINQLCR
jgi:hypothetical protein